MTVKSILSNILVKVNIFLLVFYLDNLSIAISGVLKSPTVIVLLKILFFVC